MMPDIETILSEQPNTLPRELLTDITHIHYYLQNLPKPQYDTSSSQTFAERRAVTIAEAYESYKLFSEDSRKHLDPVSGDFENTKSMFQTQFCPSRKTISSYQGLLENSFRESSSEEQFILFIEAVIGNPLTIRNSVPDYRLDKSPTSTVNNENLIAWYHMDQEDMWEYTDVEDQPRYSYNQIYQLAQRIGFPTEFEL